MLHSKVLIIYIPDINGKLFNTVVTTDIYCGGTANPWTMFPLGIRKCSIDIMHMQQGNKAVIIRKPEGRSKLSEDVVDGQDNHLLGCILM